MAECKIGKNKVRTSTKNTKMAVSAGMICSLLGRQVK